MTGFGRKGLKRVSLQPSEQRASGRSAARLPAILETPAARLSVTLVNVSRGGACVKGTNLPKAGRFAKLRVGGVSAFGEIVWREGGACGLRFDKKLKAEDAEDLHQAAQESAAEGMSVEHRRAMDAWLNGL